MNLKEENKILKKKLSLASDFINREIKSHIKKISKRDFSDLQKNSEEKLEDTITKNIYNYFWDELIFSLDKTIIENIISAEFFYNDLLEKNFLDWVSVVVSYQKAIDFLIEKNITSLFRKFVKEKKLSLKKNNLDEKNLHQVVESWYSLGFTRLFSLIKAIKQDRELYDYGNAFRDFLEKYSYIKDIILDDYFYKISKTLADSDLFWAKRHNSKISLKEIKKARILIIWDFKDKNSLIYKLALLWEV